MQLVQLRGLRKMRTPHSMMGKNRRLPTNKWGCSIPQPAWWQSAGLLFFSSLMLPTADSMGMAFIVTCQTLEGPNSSPEVPPEWPGPQSPVRHTKRQLRCHLGESAFWGKMCKRSGQMEWGGKVDSCAIRQMTSVSSVLRLEFADHRAFLCIEQYHQTLPRVGRANTWPSDPSSVDWKSGHSPQCPLSPGRGTRIPSC